MTSQPAIDDNDITIQMDYQQDLGQSQPTYQTYSIGDTIEFAGNNWRVIKNSTTEEDYVTLMKEKVLTNTELGSYAYQNNDTTSYYFGTNCYPTNGYGYSGMAESGCAGHNDYAGSKVKELLETRYLLMIGENNLKEINGYKIRLITRNELNENLGWTSLDKYATNSDNSLVPTWVYQNIGDQNKGVYGYWTMDAYPNDLYTVWKIGIDGQISHEWVHNMRNGVRQL